jgi:acyl-CoA synthetase (AMP-forming)/AMP-acid ligase II
MPRNLIERLARICPRLATNYGMTETTSAITVIEPTTDIAVLSNTVGFPFPGVELRVVDERGCVCPSAGSGEIQTKSQNNFLGYWRRPDATEAAFTADGWFRTGDLGELRTDGRLRLVGRIKEMYKSGGYNVYPREIELVLEGHPAVAVAAVVPALDPLWQEIGVAYVVPRSPVTPEELESYCRNHLANYKVPKRILIEAYLPLLPIGKVDKRALMARTPRSG